MHQLFYCYAEVWGRRVMLSVSSILEESERLLDSGAKDAMTAVMLVFLEWIRKVDLPAELVPSLNVAERYWEQGVGGREEMGKAQAAAWKYFHEKCPGYTNMSSRDAMAARLALSVLDVELDEENLHEAIAWFPQFYEGVATAKNS